MRTPIRIAIFALMIFPVAAFAGDGCGTKTTAQKTSGTCPATSCSTSTLTSVKAGSDIVDTAVSAGSFETLVAAVKAAGLVETLKSEGPFTVFAPSDEAFAKIPAETLEALLLEENRDKLTSILTYHVVPGRVSAAQVVKLSNATTANGQRVDIKVKSETVYIDGAKVVSADIECSNGIIHVIDRVIMPESKNIVETAAAAGKFNTLIKAAKAADLAGVLTSPGPFTVFAPTDDAFAALPQEVLAALLTEEKKSDLASILKFHVVPGRVYADQVTKSKTLKTAQGSSFKIELKDGKAYVGGAQILMTDIETSNGVIHVIDRVILPEAGM